MSANNYVDKEEIFMNISWYLYFSYIPYHHTHEHYLIPPTYFLWFHHMQVILTYWGGRGKAANEFFILMLYFKKYELKFGNLQQN